jgi:hypothetical protein
MRVKIILRQSNSHPNAAAFVRSTKVWIFRCDRHIFDRDGGIVLVFGPHLNNSGVEALIFALAVAWVNFAALPKLLRK